MTRRIHCLFSLFLCLPFAAVAQTEAVDSLRQYLEQDIHDTLRVEALNDLAFQLYFRHPDSSLERSSEALALSQSASYERGITLAYYYRGIALKRLGRSGEAIEAIEAALERSIPVDYAHCRQQCHNILGLIYSNIGDIERAVQNLEESLALARAKEDPIGMAIALSNIGSIHLADENLDAASPYFRQAAEEFAKHPDNPNYPISLVNYAISLSDPEEKESALLRAIETARSHQSGYALILAYNNYARLLYQKLDRPEAAGEYFHLAQIEARDYGSPNLENTVNGELANWFYDRNQLDSAAHYFRLALDTEQESGSLEDRQRYLVDYAEVLTELGRQESAIESLQEAVELADSVRTREIRELLANADARYQLSEKESEITAGQLEIERRRAAQNRQLLYGIGLLALLAGLFQYFVYRQGRRKREVELALFQEKAEAERLRELDEMKSQFFTNVSHELRTPLTLITSPLEESLKELKQVGLENKLRTAHRNSRRLLEMTNEILDLAKLEAGKLDLAPESFLALPRVERLLAAFRSQAEIKDIDLQLEGGSGEAWAIEADPKSFDTIINNLLANAIKFTPAGGSVKLQLSAASDSLKISVQDSGPGIHPDDLPLVFDRFYQSRRAPQVEGGTGIGLALSQRLAERMGGHLRVISELGNGSTFILDLPLAIHQPQDTSVQPRKQAPADRSPDRPARSGDTRSPSSLARSRLLIVEDNQELANYLLDSLRTDYDCTLARNGREALELLEQTDFDLITSDVMMPEMDGFELREAVNQQAAWRRIPFILLTARNLEADKLRGFRLGIDDYITKPFSLPELKARLASLLRNKQVRETEWTEEIISSPEEELLAKAETTVIEHLDDPTFGVEQLAAALHYSDRQLLRLMGSSTGLTPVQFILEIRLQTARQLLEEGRFATVAEVRYEIGIESASYFSKKYKERFGLSPGKALSSTR